MTSLRTFTDYIRSFGAPLRAPGLDALAKENLVAFVNEAVQEAAKICIEAREPMMLSEWRFDIVAEQKVYPLYQIAGGTPLKGISNFARPHTLFIASRNGDEWVKWSIIDKRKALSMSFPQDKRPAPGCYFEVRPGHGGSTGTEGDLALCMENPPNYAYVQGGRLNVHILPSEISKTTDDNFEPWLPRLADTFVKRYSLRLAYQSIGKNEQYDKMEDEMDRVEQRLRNAIGSGMSDDPQSVFWEQSLEEYGN